MTASGPEPDERPAADAADTPEKSRGYACSWRELAVVFVLVALLWAGYLARTDFHVFPLEDVKCEIVAARQLAEGEGHTSRVATPTMLVFLARHGDVEPPWPNALRAPLPAMLIAGLTRVTSEPTAVALSSGIFFLLAVPLIYLIACRLSGRAAGVLAAAAFVVAPSGLYLGSTGMTESSSIFALAGIVILLMRSVSWPMALAAGALAGVGYLGRSTMVMWAMVIVVYIVWRSVDDGWWRGLLRAVAFCAPLALSVWWWGAQMEALSGKFGYNAQGDIAIRRDTGLYPGRTSSAALESWKPAEFIRHHPAVMASKYARIAEATWPDFVTMGGLALLVGLVVAEFIVVASGGKPGGVRWLIYGLIGLQLLLVPLASFGHGGVSVNRYLDPLGPLAATIGAAFAIELVRRYTGSVRRAAVPLGLVVALIAAPTVCDVAVGPYHQSALQQWDRIAETFASVADEGDIVATTYGPALAWATGLYAVEIPTNPKDFRRMHRELLAVDWVHLKHRAGNAAWTHAWEPIMQGEKQLSGFEMHARLDDGSVILRRTGDG